MATDQSFRLPSRRRAMTKVHPSARTLDAPTQATAGAPEVLTVWRKSLLFNCSGFTVFNADGDLAFRVDNYSSGNRGEVVLMDAAGKPLLTLRRKRLSLGDRWMVYEGEETVNHRFSAKKHVSFRQSKALAHVTPRGASASASASAAYEIEGSYARRSCAVYSAGRRELLAEIQRKEAAANGVAFGADVFRLVVRPGIDAAVAMAIVILLEQMFGSRG